jgi:multimeric flavodoxin WrbA
MKNILILNGSINSENGNTAQLLKHVENILQKEKINYKNVCLENNKVSLKELLHWADGFVISTGTYWDSWGSPLQKFFEDATEFEAQPEILFKPCSVIVTMHAFGGKSVLSRIQGVVNTMGMSIPPMSGMVYGLAIQEALKNSDSFAKDFWSIEDLEIVIHNLLTAVKKEYLYQSWPVDRKDPKRRWITCEN